MSQNPRKKLKNLPNKPGVYLFKNAENSVLYIGKAHNLKSRVSQYYSKRNDGRAQIPFLMHDATDFDYIVTDNDIECLFLENTLIKKYKPKYNIKLRDDKNYAFLKIDYETEIPQIYTVRSPDAKNAKYFGPYSSTLKIRETLHILRKIFPFCANKKISKRPCFYYYLHRCPGICIGKISPQEYQKTIDKICLFLSGNITEIKRDVNKQMRAAAEVKQFEKAADFRNQMRSLEVIEERQNVIFTRKVNWDFISHFQTADKTTINVFVIRNGKMIDRKNFILEDTQNKNAGEIISAFLAKYYLEATDLPKEVFVQDLPEDALLFSGALKNIHITRPAIGKKAKLIKMGVENAKEFFETWALGQVSELSKTTLALDELAKVLKLAKPPFRLECFDISNIQGTNSVASMVVFEGGKPKKSDYRKFKIQIDGSPNDFEMMREALSRRFAIKHSGTNEKAWPNPDLLVVDGGKGQLTVAVEVLKMRNLNIPVIGLAKKEEEIFVPGKSIAILLPHSNYALQLLQRLRDEAHRFAIAFHKKLRSRGAFKSALDDIPGIGPVKKKLLIKNFGSVQKIKSASLEELVAVVGDKLARIILSQS